MELPEHALHAIDFAATGGLPMRWIRNDPEIMQLLDTKMRSDTGFSIGDHVRCCMTELDKFDEAWRNDGKV